MKKTPVLIAFISLTLALGLSIFIWQYAFAENEEGKNRSIEPVRFEKRNLIYEPGSVYIYQRHYATHEEDGTFIKPLFPDDFSLSIDAFFIIEKHRYNDFVEMVNANKNNTLLDFRNEFSNAEFTDGELLAVSIFPVYNVFGRRGRKFPYEKFPLGEGLLEGPINTFRVYSIEEKEGVLLLGKLSDDFIAFVENNYGFTPISETSRARRFSGFDEVTTFTVNKKLNIDHYEFEIEKMTSGAIYHVQLHSPNIGCVAVLRTPELRYSRPNDHHEGFPGYTSLNTLALFLPPAHYGQDIFYNDNLLLFENEIFYVKVK